MEKFQIGSGPSGSAEIIRRLSELQNYLRHFYIVILTPERPQKGTLAAKTHNSFVFVVVSKSVYILRLLKYQT